MLLTKSPNSYGKNCSAPRALQVEKYSALTKFCSAPGTRAIGFLQPVMDQILENQKQ